MSTKILLKEILQETKYTRSALGDVETRLARVETGLTSVEKRLGKVEVLLTGNGSPEKGLASRLERLEHWRGVVVWTVIWIFTPVLAAGVAFVLSK